MSMEGDMEEIEETVDPLSCPYCTNLYKDPVLLPCLCTVCRSCIPKFGGKKGLLVCPSCKEKSPIPADGFDGLPRNVIIEGKIAASGSETGEQVCLNCEDGTVVFSYCRDCLQFLCQACHDAHDRVALCNDHVTVEIEELERNDPKQLKKYRRMAVCRKHRLERDRLCRKCNAVICKTCAATSHHADREHDVIGLPVAVHHYRDMLGELHQVAEKRSVILHGRTKHIEDDQEGLRKEDEDAMANMYEYYTKVGERIDEQKERMKSKLDAAYLVRENEIEEQERELAETLANTKLALEISKGMLLSPNDKELISMMGFVVARMESLTNGTTTNGVRRDRTKDQSIHFERNESKMKRFEDLTSELGDVKLSTFIPPVVIQPGEEIDDFNAIICGIPSVIPILGFGGEQQLAKINPHQFRAEIRDPGDIVLPCNISRVKSGTFLCKFRPQVMGEHSLRIKLNGHHIKGSPMTFTVHTNNKIEKTDVAVDDSEYISEEEEDAFQTLVKPIGIAVDGSGDVYVTDQLDERTISRVVVYDTGLHYRRQFPLPFGSVYDVAFDRRGHLVISEHSTNAVHIYTTAGKSMNKIDHRDMKKPCGVAVDRNDNILVADSEVKCIFIFTNRGKLLQKIGEPGREQGKLQEPNFLAVERNKSSDIYVSDTASNKIVAYSRKGVCGGEIKASGHGRGKVNKPNGIARDRHGNLLICGSVDKKVMIYTATGGFISTIDSDDDPLYDPHGLVTTKDGCVLVADTGNKCIKKYRYL